MWAAARHAHRQMREGLRFQHVAVQADGLDRQNL